MLSLIAQVSMSFAQLVFFQHWVIFLTDTVEVKCHSERTRCGFNGSYGWYNLCHIKNIWLYLCCVLLFRVWSRGERSGQACYTFLFASLFCKTTNYIHDYYSTICAQSGLQKSENWTFTKKIGFWSSQLQGAIIFVLHLYFEK